MRTYKVLYPVFGAEYCKENPLVVGPFTLYNPKVHRQHLLNKYPHSKEILVAAYDPNPENKKLEELEKRRVKVVIGVSIEARETKSANEKALIKLRQFENFIRFMIGDQENNYDVGIFNFNEIKYTTGIFLCDETAGSTSSLTGTFEKISLNKFPINDPKYGHDRLWLMLDKKKPNDLEKRILSAVTWVGKGLRDEEPARAFVQYVFALEALLQLQQDSLVSPSITYAISEMSAFIIAENLENRLLIEDMVKRIYKKRSAIAHGGTHEVEAALLQDALWLVRVLISLLLINEEFKDIKSIDDLSKWVKKQKYSS
ncbi:hypothetical protein ACLHWY_23455 [Priestia aryabhattai]|uniref:hypothetical protein n=1 Tax=Priestia aryabhattai TaxID=412384 RepID=UPI003983821E